MNIPLFKIIIILIFSSSIISAATVSGRFVVVSQDGSKLSILLQLNTNTGTDDLGGSTVVVEFDNTLLNIPNTPQRNIDYYFHNFSTGNYSLGTLTKPTSSMIWINIDLPFNKSNSGTIVAKDPNWTDVVTINFDLINSTDSIGINWLTSSPFWGIYDGDNTVLWTTGGFENFIGKINFDTTSPMLLSSILLDPITLELTFSESLNNISALNTSNYSISDGINVQDAFLSEYQDIVTLHTDNHTSGSTYTITAQNIYDLSGNLINGEHNSAEYTCNNDSIAPLLGGIIVQNNRAITVNFSERLDYNSAANKNNYSISNNISVSNVQILPDSSSVKLNTSRQNTDTEYTLTVSNIKDRVGNNVYPNPSSMLYRTPKKGKGGPPRQNPILTAKSNSWHQYFIPEKTIDGKGMIFPDSRWQSEDVMPVTINYDLGEFHSFDSLRISFYKWESGRMFKYSVYTSKDSINWEPAIEEIWSDNSEWTEINFDSVETRYMKLLLLKSNQGPFASIWEVEMFGTDNVSSIETTNQIPEAFGLSQNYPNPFNPSTRIKFTIPTVSSQHIVSVRLKVYDILGNEVATLVDEEKEAGNYEVEFSSANLASGIYIYHLQTSEFTDSKKMVLLR
jgi:hypothetical protein